MRKKYIAAVLLALVPAGTVVAAKGPKDLPPAFSRHEKTGQDHFPASGWGESGIGGGSAGEDLPRAFSEIRLTPVTEDEEDAEASASKD